VGGNGENTQYAQSKLSKFSNLEEQTMPVVVDHGRLTKFLDSTVSLTKNYKIEKLEKLYSLYTSCIYSHCQDYDKTLMIEVSMISRVCVVLHMPRYS
jgi:hypothetical protein